MRAIYFEMDASATEPALLGGAIHARRLVRRQAPAVDSLVSKPLAPPKRSASRDSKGRPIGRRRNRSRETTDRALTPKLVERCYVEGKVHYEMARSFDTLMSEIVSFQFACDKLDGDSWIDRKIGIRAHSLALKFRSLSSDLAKVGLDEAATTCMRAVSAIVETARVGTASFSILAELETARPTETARDRFRNDDEVLAQVIELAWSTDEWLLQGNWNQRWASICDELLPDVPDRVLARPAGVTPNALRVARRKARISSAKHNAYAVLNMVGLCKPALLPESVVPVLEHAIDGETFAPVARQVVAGILMASTVREHRLSAAGLLRQVIADAGDDDLGRLESIASLAECEAMPWVQDDERYREWWAEIAKRPFW